MPSTVFWVSCKCLRNIYEGIGLGSSSMWIFRAQQEILTAPVLLIADIGPSLNNFISFV